MRLKFHPQIKVPLRAATHTLAALATQPDACSVGNPGWHLHLYILHRRTYLTLRVNFMSLQGNCPGGTTIGVFKTNFYLGFLVLASHDPGGLPCPRSASATHAAAE